jgi:hypothetical protein
MLYIAYGSNLHVGQMKGPKPMTKNQSTEAIAFLEALKQFEAARSRNIWLGYPIDACMHAKRAADGSYYRCGNHTEGMSNGVPICRDCAESIGLKWPEEPKPNSRFIRTCQECGNEQEMKDPKTIRDPNEHWREAKCLKCKSESLDFGGYRWYTKDGTEVTEDETSPPEPDHA